MRRFFNRLSKALLVFALSVGAVHAADGPSPFATPAAPAAAVETSMRAEDTNMSNLLDRIGYSYTTSDNTAGTKSFYVKGSRDGLDFQIRMTVSGNGKIVWLNTVVAEVKHPESANPMNFVALLEANSRLSPATFSYNENDHYIRMARCFPYELISAQYLREEIDIHLDTLASTRSLWDTAKWSTQPVSPVSLNEQKPAAPTESQSASAAYHKYVKLSESMTASNQDFVNEVIRFNNGNDYDVVALRAAFNNVVVSHRQVLAELDSMAGGDYAAVNAFVAAARGYAATDLEQAERWGARIVEIIEQADASRIFSGTTDLTPARAELIEVVKAMSAENGFAVEFEKTLNDFVIRYGLNDQTA